MATYKTIYDFEITGGLGRQLNQHISLFGQLNREISQTHRLLAGMRFGGGGLGGFRGLIQEVNTLRQAMKGLAVDPLDKAAKTFGRSFEARVDAVTRHVETSAMRIERALARAGSAGGGTGRSIRYTGRGSHEVGRHNASTLPGIIGVGGGVHTGVEIITQGAAAVREDIRAKNAGLSAAESRTLANLASSLSVKYPSISKLSIREQGRLLIPNVGDFKTAASLLPQYIEGQAALQTLAKPGEGQKDMEAFARFVDITGHSMSPGDTRTLLDSYVRARQIDPEAIKSLDFVQAAKAAGAVGKSLSPTFLGEILPGLISQQGGARTGTDINSAYQNTAISRATDTALMAQALSGMRTGLTYTTDKNGKRKVVNKGGLVDAELYGTSPYEWAKKHVVPDMVARGMLPGGYLKGDFSQDLTGEQRSKGVQYLSDRFSNRRGANIFSIMIQDMDQMEKFLGRLHKTRGLSDVLKDQVRDPFVSYEATKQQAGNLASALSQPSMDNLTGGLNRLNDNLGRLAGVFERHPGGAQAAFSGVAAGVGGLTAAGGTALAIAAVGTLSLPALAIGTIAGVTIGTFLFPWKELYDKMGWKPGIALGGKDVGGVTLNPGDELPGLGKTVSEKVAKGITGYDFGTIGAKTAKEIGTGFGTFDLRGIGTQAGAVTAKGFEAAPFDTAGQGAAMKLLRGFLTIMGKFGEASGVSGVSFGGGGVGGLIHKASLGGVNDNRGVLRALGRGGVGGPLISIPSSVPMTATERNELALISKYESGGRNVPNYINDRTHTAQGYYQITNTNWRKLAPALGITAKSAMAASMEDQTRVALALRRSSGLGNWTRYNDRLRGAFGRGEQAPMPVVPTPPQQKMVQVHTTVHLDGRTVGRIIANHQADDHLFPKSAGGMDTHGSWRAPGTPVTDAA